MTMFERIQPRSGVAFLVPQGACFEVVDPDGGQVSDLLAFASDDPREALSNGRTFDYEETIKLGEGNTLWSNRSRPLLKIVKDTVGVHDFLLTPCSKATFRHFYPDKPVHRGCFGNLAAALKPFGIEEDDLPCAFNVFMNVPVDGVSGALEVKPPVSKSGDIIRFRAECDLIIGLTACSAYASNGGSFKPIDYRVVTDV
ncbi:DUF1989 domain-containing protein [Erythrobacter aureus]|uniref:DUF1989 domain-containing protein n=1 Tax=Erythrobacter aureus TaxID=2182384 RepID=UPI003A90BB11